MEKQEELDAALLRGSQWIESNTASLMRNEGTGDKETLTSKLKNLQVSSLYISVATAILKRSKQANDEAYINMPLKMCGIPWRSLIQGLFC